MLKSRCWFCFLIAIGAFSLLAKIHTFESSYDFSEKLLNIQQNFFQAFNPSNYTDEVKEYTTLQLQSLNISSGSGKNSAISEPEITSANTIVTDTATNDKVTTSTDDIVKASTEVGFLKLKIYVCLCSRQEMPQQ